MAISCLFLAVCLQLDGVTAEVKGREADLFSACAERHVAATETSYLTAPFRFRSENRMWQTEFWGKWMHAAAPLFRMTGVRSDSATMRPPETRGTGRLSAASGCRSSCRPSGFSIRKW